MIGDRLTVGHLPLKQTMEVQILLPEPCDARESPFANNTAGRLLLVATSGSDPEGAGSIPAPATRNDEIQMTNDERNPKHEIEKNVRHFVFEI